MLNGELTTKENLLFNQGNLLRENKLRATTIITWFTSKKFRVKFLNTKFPLPNSKFTQLDIKSKMLLDVTQTLRIRWKGK